MQPEVQWAMEILYILTDQKMASDANLLYVRLDDFIQNRKPGPQGQVRGDRLCHRSNLFKVSGVRFQVSVKIES